MIKDKTDNIIGCLLGTAVGDALGLPYEGLSAHKQRKLIRYINHHALVLGKGMVSDDTEHTCMVAQSLLLSSGEEKLFKRSLAWRFRWWLLSLPAGIGYATLRAIIKLWLGFSPTHSGVFSAGNGPAMRSAIIGVCYGDNLPKLRSLVRLSTRITHTDPKAEYGALTIAIAAFLSSQSALIAPSIFYDSLQTILGEGAEEFLNLIKLVRDSVVKQETVAEFAASLGLTQGISGYVYHTVPVVIHVWLRHQHDYTEGIREIIQLGGDTDTTAAILGGIIGAAVGKAGIPSHWLSNIWEYPRSIYWIEKLGMTLAQSVNGVKQTVLPIPIYAILLRNIIFLMIVIFHGFRRLFLF